MSQRCVVDRLLDDGELEQNLRNLLWLLNGKGVDASLGNSGLLWWRTELQVSRRFDSIGAGLSWVTVEQGTSMSFCHSYLLTYLASLSGPLRNNIAAGFARVHGWPIASVSLHLITLACRTFTKCWASVLLWAVSSPVISGRPVQYTARRTTSSNVMCHANRNLFCLLLQAWCLVASVQFVSVLPHS